MTKEGKSASGLTTNFAAAITVSGAVAEDNGTIDLSLGKISDDVHLRDITFGDVSTSAQAFDSTAFIDHSCDVHVTDEDGADIENVTVLCEDTNGTQVFSVSTAADGTITQQFVTSKTIKNPDTETTVLTPHKFTITKAGFEPVIISEVTVAAKLVYEVVLSSPIGAMAQAWR